MPRISSIEWGPPRQNSQKLEKNIQIGPQAAEIEIVIINILDTEEDMELESEICPSSQVTLVHQYSNLAMDSYHGYTTVYTRNHVETQVMMIQGPNSMEYKCRKRPEVTRYEIDHQHH
ncbi:hypothetical protein RUM43_011285 [Polyplax serrata]|uniref:Uncharacterized protein n=1 Tax=Polyplax serrata TaxID=468196 RepID=A0AAN8P8V6_POLSC